jgi:hypothetical protein
MAVQYNPGIVTSGLVLCLDAANRKSYPGTGTGWFDLSGNENTGILTNGPVYNNENAGYFTLDGANDFINGTSISSQFTADITAEAWIYVTSAGVDWVRIIGTGNNPIGNRTFGLWYASDRRLLWQRYGAGDPSIYPASPIIQLNTWNHVVATTTGSNHMLYLNGVSIGSNVATGPWAASNEPITIGFAGIHTYHNGRISNARLYNRGLSETEILQNFNALRGRFGI